MEEPSAPRTTSYSISPSLSTVIPCSASPASTKDCSGAAFTGASGSGVTGAKRSATRVTTPNAVSARDSATARAPVGNSSRTRWSEARLSRAMRHETTGDPCVSLTSIVTF